MKVNKLHGILNSFHLEVMFNLISACLLLQTCQLWNAGILRHMNSSLISFIHCLIYLECLNDGPRNNFLKNKDEMIYFKDKDKSQSKFCISKKSQNSELTRASFLGTAFAPSTAPCKPHLINGHNPSQFNQPLLRSFRIGVLILN